MNRPHKLCCWLSVLGAACAARDDSNDSTVERARVVDVIATPPESTPGAAVQLQAIVVSPDGPSTPTLAWSVCRTMRAPSENTAAAAACASGAEQPIGAGELTLATTIPPDACMRFGSETAAGRTANRADATGGFYQPFRVALGAEVTLARVRVRCALASAPIAAARSFVTDYQNNNAPRIVGVHALSADVEVDWAALPATGDLVVRLEAAQDARESYLFYDARAGVLAQKRELLSASWFVSRGSFASATIALDGDQVDNRWSRPADQPLEDLWLWIVLRDDRGGSAVETRALHFAAP